MKTLYRLWKRRKQERYKDHEPHDEMDTLHIKGSSMYKDTLHIKGSYMYKDTLHVKGSYMYKDTLHVKGSFMYKDTLHVKGSYLTHVQEYSLNNRLVH